jgi:hypothetical protein
MEILDCGFRRARLSCDWKMNRTRDAVVRILMNLTCDVERFDSLVVLQRKMLEERSADDELPRRAERLNREAAEIAARARHALTELRGLSVSASD